MKYESFLYAIDKTQIKELIDNTVSIFPKIDFCSKFGDETFLNEVLVTMLLFRKIYTLGFSIESS